MNNKTAMQQLIEILKKDAGFITENDCVEDRYAKMAYLGSIKEAEKLLEEEKKQIINSFNEGYREGESDQPAGKNNNIDVAKCSNAIEYYQSTYQNK